MDSVSSPYQDFGLLEAFHIRCLKSILGIHWWHNVTHVEIRHRAAGIDSAEHLLLQRQLRWVGHVIRMPSNRLPRRVLYGELVMVSGCLAALSCGTWTTSVVS